MCMRKLVPFILLFLAFSIQAEYMLSEVGIDTKTETNSFFDKQSLAEIARVTDETLIDETIVRINDFFTSTGIHFESRGRYTTLKDGYYSRYYIAPTEFNQKSPVFVVDIDATPIFLRAYAQFMNVKVKKLLEATHVVFTQIKDEGKDLGSPMLALNFNSFYTCLRAMSISSHGERPDYPCLSETIRSLKLKDESAISDLANAYIVLYRASRISFRSTVPIQLTETKLRESCQMMERTYLNIQINQMRMMDMKQPGLIAMATGQTAAWDAAIGFYYVAPKVIYLLGPYVTAYERSDKSISESPVSQRRLCLF